MMVVGRWLWCLPSANFDINTFTHDMIVNINNSRKVIAVIDAIKSVQSVIGNDFPGCHRRQNI